MRTNPTARAGADGGDTTMYAVEVTWTPNGTAEDLPRVEVYPTDDATEQNDVVEKRCVFGTETEAKTYARGWQPSIDGDPHHRDCQYPMERCSCGLLERLGLKQLLA